MTAVVVESRRATKPSTCAIGDGTYVTTLMKAFVGVSTLSMKLTTVAIRESTCSMKLMAVVMSDVTTVVKPVTTVTSVLACSTKVVTVLLGIMTSLLKLIAVHHRIAHAPQRVPSGASRHSGAGLHTLWGYVMRRTAGDLEVMHTAREREKLIARVRRIRGQVEAVERAIAEGKGCYEVLQTVTAARGALNGLVAEMIEDHVRYHVLDPEEKVSARRARAADELVDIVRAYVK